MPFLSEDTINSNGVKVGFWRLDEDGQGLYALAEAFLSDGEKTVCQNFKNDRRRREWLAARVLLHEMLGYYPGIEYDGGGCPRIKSLPEMKISISHTDGLVAVSLSRQASGIDLERISPRIIRIRDKFLHQEEFDYVPDNLALRLLYIQWCAKEAMYKACNVANYDYQNTYTLPGFRYDGSTSGSAKGRAILDDGSARMFDVNYMEIDGCVCCVAC